jgi:endoglucanase
MVRFWLRPLLFVAMVLGVTGLASPAAMAAGPDFALSASPSSLSVGATQSVTTQITVTPSGGFAAPVSLSVSGLPAGATATLTPGPSAGVTVLRLSASSSVATGRATITVTGTGGGITHMVAISLTVAGFVSDFAIFANPTSLTLSAGSSATSTIGATKQSNSTALPTFTASGLPAGVTASFGPTTATANGSTATLTLTAAGTAPAAATVTVTGMLGSIRATATIALTVTAGSGSGGGDGSVTITPAIPSASPWFLEEDVRIANPAALTALSVTIVVQRTTGVSFSGQFNTAGGQVVQSSTSTATTIAYQFTLAPGQALAPGAGWTFAAQASGTGTFHPTAGDTFTVTCTTGGVTSTQSAHYPMVDPVP